MENLAEKRHNVTIDGRKRAAFSGICKVITAHPTEIALETSAGGLRICGKNLKINAFSEDSGALSMDGEIDKLEYDRVKQPLFKRIFK